MAWECLHACLRLLEKLSFEAIASSSDVGLAGAHSDDNQDGKVVERTQNSYALAADLSRNTQLVVQW